MIDRTLADVVVTVHFAYIAFVVLGGLAVARWPRVAWLHLPAAAWGTLVELMGLGCPLTPLENFFRTRAGESAYTGDFIQRYLLAAIYPRGLTRTIQLVLGCVVVVLNLAAYAWVLRQRRRAHADRSGSDR